MRGIRGPNVLRYKSNNRLATTHTHTHIRAHTHAHAIHAQTYLPIEKRHGINTSDSHSENQLYIQKDIQTGIQTDTQI